MHVLHAISVVSQQNFAQKVAHYQAIPLAKENSKISTDVRDNDVIVLKFERFRRKTLSFERLYLSSLWIKLCKLW